jgi:hypothetical protein
VDIAQRGTSWLFVHSRGVRGWIGHKMAATCNTEMWAGVHWAKLSECHIQPLQSCESDRPGHMPHALTYITSHVWRHLFRKSCFGFRYYWTINPWNFILEGWGFTVQLFVILLGRDLPFARRIRTWRRKELINMLCSPVGGGGASWSALPFRMANALCK